jgi:hypothetical protein
MISRFSVASLAALVAFTLALAQAPQAPAQITVMSGGNPLPQPPGGDDCYNLSAEDLATIPWENGAGAWGAQVQFVDYTAPVTSGDPVYVSTTAEFETATMTDGQVIIFDTSISEDELMELWGDNLDIVIPAGITVGLFLNGFAEPDRFNIRIRGETPCEHSGGRAGQLRLSGTNIILDGFDTNSSGSFGGGGEAEQYSCVRADGDADDTLLMVNMRGLCAYQGFYFGAVGLQIFCRDSNFLAGAAADTGLTGQWAYRTLSARHYHDNCDYRTDRFAAIRPHAAPGASGELFWSKDSTYVNYAEGRVFWIWHALDGAEAQGEGFVLINPRIAAHSVSGGCQGGADSHLNTNNTHASGLDVAYTRIYSADIYSSGVVTGSQAGLNTEAARSADGDWDDGNNTFNSWAADLSWDPDTGDPTEIAMADGLTQAYGEGSCTPPGFM